MIGIGGDIYVVSHLTFKCQGEPIWSAFQYSFYFLWRLGVNTVQFVLVIGGDSGILTLHVEYGQNWMGPNKLVPPVYYWVY
jgi:hypothetical protein